MMPHPADADGLSGRHAASLLPRAWFRVMNGRVRRVGEPREPPGFARTVNFLSPAFFPPMGKLFHRGPILRQKFGYIYSISFYPKKLKHEENACTTGGMFPAGLGCNKSSNPKDAAVQEDETLYRHPAQCAAWTMLQDQISQDPTLKTGWMLLMSLPGKLLKTHRHTGFFKRNH